jgi:hypothetical protein
MYGKTRERQRSMAARNGKGPPRERDPNPRLIGNQPPERFVKNVELQVLDKVVGRVSRVEAKIGDRIAFGRLEILPLRCWKSFPEENPENKLLLKIFELDRQTGENRMIFYGWIFSSTPSVFGLEHPMYDLRLRNCSE